MESCLGVKGLATPIVAHSLSIFSFLSFFFVSFGYFSTHLQSIQRDLASYILLCPNSIYCKVKGLKVPPGKFPQLLYLLLLLHQKRSTSFSFSPPASLKLLFSFSLEQNFCLAAKNFKYEQWSFSKRYKCKCAACRCTAHITFAKLPLFTPNFSFATFFIASLSAKVMAHLSKL